MEILEFHNQFNAQYFEKQFEEFNEKSHFQISLNFTFL
jgi:hypothetical protein